MTTTEPTPESWFSDEANRKMEEIERLQAAGERVPFELLAGLCEPRVQPTSGERCVCCGSDARPESFGGGDGKHCGLCIGRGHEEES